MTNFRHSKSGGHRWVLPVIVFLASGQLWSRAQTECDLPLTASSLAYSDNYGSSVAVSGDFAIVGASLHDQNGTNSGAAYIFRWNGTSWAQESKLLASDAAQSDAFGSSVAIDGTVAVVVAPSKYVNSVQTGMTYVFRRVGTQWIEQQKFPVGFSGTPDLVGSTAAISGDTIVVGNSSDRTRGLYAGAVNMFQWYGTTWVEKPRITASDAANVDFFGYSVSIHGGWLAVGAFADDDRGSSSGSAYVFQRSDNGTPTNPSDDTWVQRQKLTATDGAAYNQFGYSVSVNSNLLAIGANQDSDRGVNFGSVYIYRLNGSTWTPEAELFSSGGIMNGSFGGSVAALGDLVIVGAPKEKPFWTNGGAAYSFRKNATTWIEETEFADPNAYANNYFGGAVAISNGRILVGAVRGQGTGAATVFATPCDGGEEPECTVASDCDDANPCTTDSCVNQVCQNVNNTNACADDGRECTTDVCSNGVCTHPNKASGTACGSSSNTACDAPDTCDGAGTCVDQVKANGVTCAAASGDCDLVDRCDGVSKVCADANAASGAACTDDGNSCTSDICNAQGTCTHPSKTNGTACADDGNSCTNDVCTSGVCTHPNKPSGSACGNSTPGLCDNADSCNGSGVCLANNLPNGTTCADDGNDCTNDQCSNGVCAHPAKANGTTCAPDSSQCTNDVCSAGVCTHPNKPAGTACGSSSAGLCDNPDTCNSSGVCLANNLPNGTVCADDGNECTTDRCTSGVCVHPVKANGTICGDTNVCNGRETCQSGTCAAGTSLQCNDGDPCTVDSCNSTSGCMTQPVTCPSGQTCVEGTCEVDACNDDDVCDATEDMCTCPGDCMTVDALCGNGICDAYAGEDCLSCPEDCRSRLTGPESKQFCCGAKKPLNNIGCSSAACNTRGWICEPEPPICLPPSD